MVKAIFLDVDGTLVSFKTHRVPDSTVYALEEVRKKGIKTFVATGRQSMAINNLGDLPFDGYITLNGSICYAGKEQVIFKQRIDPEDLRSLVRYQQEVEVFPVMALEENAMSVNLYNEEVKHLFGLLNFVTVPLQPLETILNKDIYQLVSFFTKEQEPEVMKVLPHCTATRWYPSFADVVPTGIDKAVGMDKTGEYFGFTAAETIAFGDGGNDVAMLRHAGTGVAMGNAVDSVKATADYITDSVDDDGILNALRHLGII